MLVVNDRVRLIDENLDKQYGIMSILSIKNGYATCANLDYAKFGQIIGTFLLTDLKIA